MYSINTFNKYLQSKDNKNKYEFKKFNLKKNIINECIDSFDSKILINSNPYPNNFSTLSPNNTYIKFLNNNINYNFYILRAKINLSWQFVEDIN